MFANIGRLLGKNNWSHFSWLERLLLACEGQNCSQNQRQVALFRLGGSLEQIDRFSRHYSTHLEPKGGPLNQKDDARSRSCKNDFRKKNGISSFDLKTICRTTVGLNNNYNKWPIQESSFRSSVDTLFQNILSEWL